MTMTCKINKLEKPGRQLRIFHTFFGRSAAFYGHFRADTVTPEWSIRISYQHPFIAAWSLRSLKNSMLFLLESGWRGWYGWCSNVSSVSETGRNTRVVRQTVSRVVHYFSGSFLKQSGFQVMHTSKIFYFLELSLDI